MSTEEVKPQEAKDEEMKEEIELSQSTTWRIWKKSIQEAIAAAKN